MRLKAEDNIVLSNTTNEKRFTINASAKAFRILSDGLYSRKIEAIVRELSCNAYDSHVMAGCVDKPFIVHLPNEWEPEFSVEDFGIGLDDEDIENIYTSYFTSTKTDSNDVIGALGLGSKTPFSYTDTFNIRARKDGVERVYNAFINSSGEPSVSILSSSPTNECNGVKITVPVRKTDFPQFKNDAETIFKWFKVTPTIDGNDNFNVDNSLVTKLEDDGAIIKVYAQGNNYITNTVVSVMGNVAYTVSDVSTKISSDLWSVGEINFLKQNLIYIKFDIGDLDVAASRETISFDEDTRDIFVERVKNVIANYTEKAQKYIDEESTSFFDSLDYIEKNVGIWGFSLFTYKGENLYTLSSSSVSGFIDETLTYKKDFIDESGQVVSRDHSIVEENIFYTRNGRVLYQSPSYIYSDHFRKYVRAHKINIIQGNGIAERGTKNVSRAIHNENVYNTLYTYITTENISNAMYYTLIEMFGEENVNLYDSKTLILQDKERRKVERDRIKAQKAIGVVAADKQRTDRIKKEQIRATVYQLIDGRIVCTENSVFDVDFFTDKKYAIIPVMWGHMVGRHINDFNIDDVGMNMLMHLMDINVIILPKKVNFERVKNLLVDGVDVELKLVRGNINQLMFVDQLVYANIINKTKYFNDVNNGNVIERLNHIEVKRHKDFESVSTLINRAKWYKYTFDRYVLPYNIKMKIESVASNIINRIDSIIRDSENVVNSKYPMLNADCSYIEKSILEEYIEMVDKYNLMLEENGVEYSKAA